MRQSQNVECFGLARGRTEAAMYMTLSIGCKKNCLSLLSDDDEARVADLTVAKIEKILKQVQRCCCK